MASSSKGSHSNSRKSSSSSSNGQNTRSHKHSTGNHSSIPCFLLLACIVMFLSTLYFQFTSTFSPDAAASSSQQQKVPFFGSLSNNILPHEEPVETFFSIPAQRLYEKSKLGKPQSQGQLEERQIALKHFEEWFLLNGGEIHENVTFGFIRKEHLKTIKDVNRRHVILKPEDFTNQMGIGLLTKDGSTTTLSEHSVYLKVPQSLFINHQSIMMQNPRLAEAFRDVYQTYTLIIKHEIMFFLLHEKLVSGEESFYKPYLDVLPKAFPNCPIFWSAEELKVFHGSTLYDRVVIAREAFKQTYQLFMQNIFLPHPEIVPVEKMCFDDFLWAEWIFQTRGLYLDGRMPREVLVPGADFINSNDNPVSDPGPADDVIGVRGNTVKIGSLNPIGSSLTAADDDDNGVMLSADYDYGSNQQLYESVPNFKSNDDLLRFDGYIMENNPNDCVWLFIPFSADKKHMVKQLYGFQEHSIPQFCFSVKDLRLNKWPKNALPYLRTLVLQPPDEVPNGVDASHFHRMISKHNEEALLLHLMRIIQRLVTLNPYSELKYPRDKLDKMYERGTVNYRVWMGIRFRIFEKTKHRELLNVLQGYLDQLRNSKT